MQHWAKGALRVAVVITVVAVITAAYHLAIHVNPTTIGFTFLIAVLLISAFWGLTLAIAAAVIAAAAFNYFFLPPFGTFAIADPHNWIALAAFLITALVASNLAERARREALDANRRRMEAERLYGFSQHLLTAENLKALLNRIPARIVHDFGFASAALILTDQGELYRSDNATQLDVTQLKSVLPRGQSIASDACQYVPLNVGTRVVGALGVAGGHVSSETLDALASLVAIAIERAGAVESLAKAEASRENERLRGALLDGVAHELRTPLTGILASATALRSDSSLDESQRADLLAVVEEEANRLNRLVGEVAEMSQLDSGAFTLDLQLVSIRTVIDEAVAATRSLLKGHALEIQLGADLPDIRIDAERICQVLRHLLENAAKYAPAGTPICITSELRDHSLVTSVRDQGPGIEAAELQLIFDKFYRGRVQRFKAEGTGMGLAIAKVIVEAHGGMITVSSTPGIGSVFTLTLPASHAQT
jgi:two-component system sensor histidine kinase KdpD